MNIEESARDQKLAELELLRQSLDNKEKEAQDYKDKWLRSRADIENFRKRVERERVSALGLMMAAALGPFLGVLDELKRAAQALSARQSLDPKIKEGFELIVKNMDKIFDDYGVTKVNAGVGQAYDPACHEVILTEQDDGGEGLILRVEQEGYRLGEKILRPAKVVVSRKGVKT